VRALPVAIISEVSEAIILSVARERQPPRAILSLVIKQPLHAALHRDARFLPTQLGLGRIIT